MAETGHAKVVANFGTMVSFVAGYGAAYDPSNAMLELAALQLRLAAGQARLDDVTTGKAVWTVKANDRENEYLGVRKLTTRAVNALEASAGIQENDIADARSIKRKIDGARAKALPPDDPNTPDNENEGNSVSQRSYTNTAEFFLALIELFKQFPGYAPNEADLQIASLEAKHAAMVAANNAVIAEVTNLSNDRLARNDVLYDNDDSIVKLAGLVKKYVKSLFGADSPEYAQISGLEFKKR